MKMFPIKHTSLNKRRHPVADTPVFISWQEAEHAHAAYCLQAAGKVMTLQAIAKDGGFTADEMDAFAPGWQERHSGQPLPTAESKQLPLQVEISWNNAGVASVCGNCGQYVNAYVGYEPFIAGTKSILCDECAGQGVIVGPVPSGFTFFDQAAIAAEITEAERRGTMPKRIVPPVAPRPDDDIPF